jgi:hypothetical protein
MDDQLSYYDILGVQPGASADDIRRACEAKMAALAPGMIAGASTSVLVAVDRARAVLEEARRTLTDRAARLRHDTEIGIRRPGAGLAGRGSMPSQGGWAPGWGWELDGRASAIAGILAFAADALAPRRRLARRVVVPDARGLFVTPARRLMTLRGLHAELVQLTEHPMPVEGVVVEQSPRAGELVRRSGTVTIQVWHPAARQRRRRTY